MSNPFEVQSPELAVAGENSRVRVKRIGILSTSLFAGTILASMSLLVVMIFGLLLLAGIAANGDAQVGGAEAFGSIAVLLFVPVIYGGAGFVGGAISAFMYNLIAGITGGIALELAPDR